MCVMCKSVCICTFTHVCLVRIYTQYLFTYIYMYAHIRTCMYVHSYMCIIYFFRASLPNQREDSVVSLLETEVLTCTQYFLRVGIFFFLIMYSWPHNALPQH